MKINDVVLRSVTKFVAFIILAFSFYMFFAGHHNPGGGFIGGLLSAAALILLYLAFDAEYMKRVLPIDYIQVIAIGLLLAIVTGLGSLWFDVPFLTHTSRDLPVFGGSIELATALLFDLGVYLTVVGVTMTIILTIGEDVDEWNS